MRILENMGPDHPFGYYGNAVDYETWAYLNYVRQQEWQREQQQYLLVLSQFAENFGYNNAIDYSRLTSFLQVDDSFLTPWNWKPDSQKKNFPENIGRKQLMKFEPGSFFSY
ncbi:hypothetical protein ACH5RR_010027 [Cinchona calisaya]|uniref:Uncharacterized protein n=1 Tax=Cinchona calisaya TaxID=153742 RepID=A0ABD3AFT7_9GENT